MSRSAITQLLGSPFSVVQESNRTQAIGNRQSKAAISCRHCPPVQKLQELRPAGQPGARPSLRSCKTIFEQALRPTSTAVYLEGCVGRLILQGHDARPQSEHII